MHIDVALRALVLTRVLKRHDRWSRAKLAVHQARRLAALRAFAMSRSPFYAELHRGLERAPLAELPTVTKAMIQQRFDDVATDPRVRLADVRAYVESSSGTDPFRGALRVAMTSGASGRPAISVYGRADWAWQMASYARGQILAGLDPTPLHRIRMAVVASPSPWHASSQVAATAGASWMPTIRLGATTPITEVVRALNDFQPDVLVSYASVATLLAGEQRAGRLAIRPSRVFSASEPLLPSMRVAIEAAFGARVFDEYGASETGLVAAECEHHRKHLFEDLVVIELVDESGQPTPVGQTAARVLVTPLYGRTLPLIRYEMSDRLQLSDAPCPCGRPFLVVEKIDGRSEDLLRLRARDGRGVALHPVFVHALMDGVDVAGWQLVVAETDLSLLVVNPGASFSSTAVQAKVVGALAEHDVGTPVDVRVVDSIPRSSSGKAPFIRRS